MGWSKSMLPQLRGVHRLLYLLTLNSVFSNFSSVPVISNAIGHKPEPRQSSNDFKPDLVQLEGKVITEYDVVIVGSGCGGSLVAAQLSNAGSRVLLVEKGEHFDQSSIANMSEAQALDQLYERSGGVISEDFGIGTFIGSCLGGGSIVNW